MDIDEQGNIWFTEWTENKIGVNDDQKALEFSIEISTREITMNRNDVKEFTLIIEPENIIYAEIKISGTMTMNGILENVSLEFEQIKNEFDKTKSIPIILQTENLNSGIYTIMVSVESEEITQSIPVKLIIK